MSPDASNSTEKLVHHAAEDAPISMGRAFKCARCGIAYALRTQRNFKIHAAFALAAVALGFILQIPSASWLAIVLCIAAVFSLEIMNTAVEAIVDMVSPQWNELAMRAKDCAAGAVYVFAAASLVVAAVVFVPPILEMVA